MVAPGNAKAITLLVVYAHEHTFFGEFLLLGYLSDGHSYASRAWWYLYSIDICFSAPQGHNLFNLGLFYFHHQLMKQQVSYTNEGCDAG